MHNCNCKYYFQIKRIGFYNIYKQNNVEVNTNQKNKCYENFGLESSIL